MKRQYNLHIMRSNTLVVIFVSLSICAPLASAQQRSEPNAAANEVVTALAKKIETCPATTQVTQFKDKWVKVAWGPVTKVRFNVDTSDPATPTRAAVIEFSIPYSNSEHRDNRTDAETETKLNRLFLSPVRYELEVSNDGLVSVKTMKIQNTFSGKWDNYAPSNPERFCWLAAVQEPSVK